MPGAVTGLLGGGTIGGAVVRLTLDSSQFNAGLASAEGRLKGVAGSMQSIGTGMSKVGSSLTRYVTVPIVAAGAVATKMALDFNKAFVAIQTLASKGGHSIEQMKSFVLDLASATGQDPTGLANALYQVTSAGKVAAQQAFPILTASAKAAAIGMGSAADVAKVLTTAMNSYGPSTISAAQAADVLTQAQKDSAAEADALSASIGPVIGVAAQVGVSFQEVAAAMATATVAGISTERAATGLRFLLQNLAAPTDAAKTALDRYGISVQDLQRMLDKQGLIGTLQAVADKFDLTTTRGQEAWRAFTGGARGAIAANTLVGKTAGVATAELDKMNNATGRLNKSFEIWGRTTTGKTAIAIGKLKTAAIGLGEQLLPIFLKLVDAVSTLATAFNELPGPMQSALVKGLAFAALAGPFLKLGGIVTGLVLKFGQLTGALGTTGPAVASIGASADGLVAVVPQLIGVAAAIKGVVDEISAFNKGGALSAIASAIQTMGLFTGNLAANLQEVGDGLTRTQQSVQRAALGVVKAAGLVGTAERIIGAGMDSVRHAGQAAGNAVANAGNQVEHAAASMVKAGDLGRMAARGVQAVGNAATGAAGDMAKAAGSANTLTGSINHIPTKHTTTITANANQAIAAAHAAAAALNAIPRSITSVVTTVARQVTTAASHMATGGITHGPTTLVGEGTYSTFAGKGAEAVIPLNTRGIDILSKAMQKAGGGRSINVTINTQGNFNEQTLAASVSRHLARTIREEALV